VDERLLQAERLLLVDLVDRAEALFRAVAEDDPRNVDALIGVARSALARGDDHEAYRIAARAHALDPAHDMARRMEARMAEVLRTRGDVPGIGRPGTAGERSPGAPIAGPIAGGPRAAVEGRRRSLLQRLRGR
jgi:hypothetical protein